MTEMMLAGTDFSFIAGNAAECARSGTEQVLAEDSTLYDVAIIGSGPAGYTAAIRGGQYGLKVALIESDDVLGGTCLHVGCIPTKSLLFNAEIWDYLKEAAEYGIAGIGTPQLDWTAVQKRKNAIVTKHTKGLDFLMKKNKVTVVRGYESGVHRPRGRRRTYRRSRKRERRKASAQGEEHPARNRV